MLSQERVELRNGRLFVQLFIDDPEVVDWVTKVGSSDYERVDAVKKALKVGVTAMTSALVGSTSLTLQQALERWRAELERALSESREKIVQTITEQFGKQVTQPVTDQIEQVTKVTEQRIREHIDRLEKRIDPSDPKSWFGIVQETIIAIKQEFDPERENSYLWKVRNTLSEFYGRDGVATQSIKETLRQTLEPFQSIIDQIRGDITRIIERLGGITPEKGRAFEKTAVGDLLHKATSVTGDTCDHVGTDNKPGDWLITVYYGSLSNRQQIGRIVVEVKDTARKRSELDSDLISAMNQRKADVGILIFARPDQNPYGLPFVVLDKNYSKLVCVWDEQGLNFNFAYQLARLQLLENYFRSSAQVDWSSLRRQIHEIINEAERIDEIVDKARLAKERATEAERMSREVKLNLIQKLQALEGQISRQVQ